ncbi:MAG: hypothetical protein LH654_13890 [Thermoleophilia bacterium]|nr:hypothetical protein [Thermoleophilia bacterium]
MGRTIVVLVMLLAGTGAVARAAIGAEAGATAAPAYQVDGTVTVDWTETAGIRDTGHAVYAISGPLLTNAQRQAYAPIAVPKRFSFRPLAPTIPTYFRAELQSVSWKRTETIDGCGDGSVSTIRTSTVEKIVDRRAIFEQATPTSLNRLGGTSELNFGAITLYVWQNGAPQRGFTAHSNLGEVFVRATGGCPEVLRGGPATARVQMHDLLDLGMIQLGQLQVKGAKTREGTFTFHGVNRSADVSPSPSSHNTIKVAVDLRVSGPSNAHGFFCLYPTPTQLASARTVTEAQAILRRAGIFAAYAGEARNRYVPQGHYFFKSSSPSGYCGSSVNRRGLYRSSG